MAIVTKNIKTDFAALGNGSANDGPKFMDFHDWCITNQGSDQIVLTIPSGMYIWSSGSINDNLWCDGIKDLIVEGVGNPTLASNGLSGAYRLGTLGQRQDASHSARLESVHSGSYTITLVSLGDAALFTVNQYALIAGFDIQGFGYPSNPHFFEWVLPTNITGKVITLASPLRHTYLSTWPLYEPGDTLEVDMGGPATLYAYPASWNVRHLYRNFSMDQDNIQEKQAGRHLTFENVQNPSIVKSIIPSDNEFWSISGVTDIIVVEVDKLVGHAVFDSCQIALIKTQSSSVDLLTVNNSAIGSLNGTAKRADITNNTIASFLPGAFAFGRSDEINCYNNVISAMPRGGILEKGPTEAGVNTEYDMADGVISVLKSHRPARWAVPGAILFWSGQYEAQGSFRVLAVTEDATHTLVHTNLTGTFPTGPLTSGKLYIQTHPCPIWRGTGNSGCTAIEILNSAGAQGRPLHSYTRESYDGLDSAAANPSGRVWGRAQRMVFDVTSAYAGATNPLKLEIVQGTVKPDETAFTYDGFVDLRTAGTRTVTSAGVSGGGGADSGLALQDAVAWLAGGLTNTFSANVSGQSVGVTVEITTDQGAAPDSGSHARLKVR